MEPKWRHQSQRASPPAALLNANQQAERPTLLLGDWERGHWLACLHWSPVSLTVSELTQVSSWQSPLSGPASVFKWNKTAVGAGGGAREWLTAAPTTIKPAQTPNQCLSIHAEIDLHIITAVIEMEITLWMNQELFHWKLTFRVGKETSLLQNDGLSGNA